jgi:hypothetical protein
LSAPTYWSNDEWKLAKSLYDENLQHVGNELLYQTKTQLFAYIAQELLAIGSDKTSANVYNKIKNMRKHGEMDVHDDPLSDTTSLKRQNQDLADSGADDFEWPETVAQKKGTYD